MVHDEMADLGRHLEPLLAGQPVALAGEVEGELASIGNKREGSPDPRAAFI
jgi:hypothetical protein